MQTNEKRARGKGQRAAQGSGVRGQGSGYSTRIAVFLITLSGLILEVGLTRIYSASIWYHFAFVAISVALLGWGLGGFTVHVWKGVRSRASGAGEEKRTAGRMPALPALSMNTAALVAALYAVSIPLCLWLLVRYPFEMDRLPL